MAKNEVTPTEYLIKCKQTGFETRIPAAEWDAHDDIFKAEWTSKPLVDGRPLGEVVGAVAGEIAGKLLASASPEADKPEAE